MAVNIDTITLRRPDDWHVHLRDGAMLAAVLPLTARQFARAIVMPNLVPPVTDVAAARAYRERILAALPAGAAFTPLMTCYLTDATDPEEVARGYEEGVFAAVKLYPAHATTNSAYGRDRYRPGHAGARTHGGDRHAAVDPWRGDRPGGRCIRPRGGVHRPGARPVAAPATRIAHRARAHHHRGSRALCWHQAAPNLAATITAHHLVINRNAIFAGGIRPHLYCLPIAKREKHRRALRRAATSGNPRFFLGTDSAPHAVPAKETACGCAGIFTAPCALEIYAEVFEEEGALDRFEAFAALNGPEFYRLPVNETG